MKRFSLLALLTSTAALAHPWGHDGFSTATILPDLAAGANHAALIVAVVAAGLFLFYRTWARL